jgi:TetR/AcrR family transcriptional regulator, transcriptional repressor for nem operon
VATTERPRARRSTARTRLLDAAVDVIRRQGLHATTVDDVCAEAGVTKGAFFHHFASKEALAVAAAEHWATVTGEFFAEAEYHRPAAPLDRVLGYLDFRAGIIQGDIAEFTCLVGTMVQEAYATSPEIRAACAASIFGHAASLEEDYAAVIAERGAPPGVTAKSLAVHTQTVLQGAFVLAKASEDSAVVLEAIAHLRRYIECLFTSSVPTTKE